MPLVVVAAALLMVRSPFLVHLSAQCAFSMTAGMVSMALNSVAFSASSRMYVSMRREYTSL